MWKNYVLILILIVACGTERRNYRTNRDSEVQQLKQMVLELQGTVAQIDAFTANDFSDCRSGLPAFEQKICQIAQTATAEQQVIFTGQLQEITKIFQTELFGDDCIDAVEVGCPVAGSVLERIETVETNMIDPTIVADIQADIAQLQLDVSQLQGDLATLENRLNNFNGTGNSIEVVISGIESDISALESRVSDLEAAINDGDIYQTIMLCEDNAASGPVFEPVLMTGNLLEIYAYMRASNNKVGMGVLAEAGASGDQYLTTSGNTKKCKFKIYDLTTELKICWVNNDRKATTGEIDTECDSAGGFVSPTANCTCY